MAAKERSLDGCLSFVCLFVNFLPPVTLWQSWDLESYCAFYYRGEKSQVLVSDFSSTSSLPPFKTKVLGIKYEFVTQPPPISLHLVVWHSSFMVRWCDLSCLLPLSFLRASFCFWWYDKYFIPVVTAYQVLQLSFHHYHHHCFRALSGSWIFSHWIAQSIWI